MVFLFIILHSYFIVSIMRVRLIWVGKAKNEHVRALVEDYLQRLGRFTRLEVTELRESAARDERTVVAEEGERITNALRAGSVLVLLDVEGRREWNSPELAAKEVAFVVGGHLGVTPELKAKADVRWSLSRLTLTHEMARVVLVEQLYRAYTIMHGLPYQK
jgi:23S rRNA (pseudouridine1915-N3)-methyltransferase